MAEFIETCPLFSASDMEWFKSLYGEVISGIASSNECLSSAMSSEINCMEKVLKKNVWHDSTHFYGLLAYASYKYFAEESCTKDSSRMAVIAGWCAELLEASHRVKDDIMRTESPKKSDYEKQSEASNTNNPADMSVVNESLMMCNLCFKTLRHFFGDYRFYVKLRETGRTVCWKNLLGIKLADLIELNGNIKQSSNLTLERYHQIVRLTKGSRLVLPVISGIMLAGKGADRELLQKVENIVLEISQIMQVQNDFYSFFGMDVTKELLWDPEMLKTMLVEPSNTIRSVSWLLVKVLENPLVDPETAKFFADNLHASDPKLKSRIKEILVDAGIVNSFKEYIDEALANVLKSIKNNFSDGFEGRQEVPLKFFSSFLNTIKYSQLNAAR